jgi:6-phosphogluconate dehydrogenase
MTLLFSEHGSRVGCFDTDQEAVKTVLKQAKEDKVVDESLVHGYSSLDKLVEAFPTGKYICKHLSLPTYTAEL